MKHALALLQGARHPVSTQAWENLVHIILGFLTTVLTLLYVLEKLGIDVGYINPFSWARRRAWAKKYEGDPIHAVDDPVHVAAILVVGTARLGDDISADQKARIVGAFADTFSLPQKDANELYLSALHLLGAPQVLENQLTGVAERHRNTFTASQAESIVEMISGVVGEASNEEQRSFASDLTSRLAPAPKPGESWS